MSIAPISSALKTYQPGAVQGDRQIRQDVQNIARAPGGAQAPDYIAGAKDAFSAVQQLLQNPQAGKSSQTQGGANKLQNQPQNQPATDFLAVGKALFAGGLGSVQDSVKGLLGDIQAARSRQQPIAQGVAGATNSAAPATSASRPAGSRSVGTLINTTA